MFRRVAQVGAVTLVVALLGLLVWDLVHESGSKVAKEVDSGKVVAAPAWTRDRVDTSGKLSLASLRGKVVVLNFWQSYCAPCTHEARTLATAAKHYDEKGVVFVGIDVQDFRSKALKFIERFGIEYPIVKDNGSLVGHYGVIGYPETFFIDQRGRLVPKWHIIGPVTRKDLDEGIRAAQAT
jgi:cytochrome c biogenesis protein CcmG, thiol:disulfide interchange protein DsbE